jgi:hypothetical protein
MIVGDTIGGNITTVAWENGFHANEGKISGRHNSLRSWTIRSFKKWGRLCQFHSPNFIFISLTNI